MLIQLHINVIVFTFENGEDMTEETRIFVACVVVGPLEPVKRETGACSWLCASYNNIKARLPSGCRPAWKCCIILSVFWTRFSAVECRTFFAGPLFVAGCVQCVHCAVGRGRAWPNPDMCWHREQGKGMRRVEQLFAAGAWRHTNTHTHSATTWTFLRFILGWNGIILLRVA